MRNSKGVLLVRADLNNPRAVPGGIHPTSSSRYFVIIGLVFLISFYFGNQKRVEAGSGTLNGVFTDQDSAYLPPLVCRCIKNDGICPPPPQCCLGAADTYVGKVYRINVPGNGETLTIRLLSGPSGGTKIAVYPGDTNLCSSALQSPQSSLLTTPAWAGHLGGPHCNGSSDSLVLRGLVARKYFLVVTTGERTDQLPPFPLPFSLEFTTTAGSFVVEPAICNTPTPVQPTPTPSPVGCWGCRAIADVVSLGADIGVEATFQCEQPECQRYLDTDADFTNVAIRSGAWYRTNWAGDPPAPTSLPSSNPIGSGPGTSGVPDPIGAGYKLQLEGGYYAANEICGHDIVGFPIYCYRWKFYTWGHSYEPTVMLEEASSESYDNRNVALFLGGATAGVSLSHVQDGGLLSGVFEFLAVRTGFPLDELMAGAMVASIGAGVLSVPVVYELIDPQLKFVCREMKAYAGLLGDTQGGVRLRGLIINPRTYSTSGMCPCGSSIPGMGPPSTDDYAALFTCLLDYEQWFGDPIDGSLQDRSDLMRLWGCGDDFIYCGNVRDLDCYGP